MHESTTHDGSLQKHSDVLRPRQGNRDQKYCLQESCRGPRDSDSRPRNSTQTCTPCHLMSLAHLAEVENMYSLKTQKARQFISEAQMAKSKHFQLDPIGLRFWISRCGLVLEVQKRFPVLPFTLRAIEDEQALHRTPASARHRESSVIQRVRCIYIMYIYIYRCILIYCTLTHE